MIIMKLSNKISFFVLFTAFIFFTSGWCSFSMVAMASESAMSGMDSRMSDAGTKSDGRANAIYNACETGQGVSGICSLSHGNLIAQAVAKKISDLSELFPVAGLPGAAVLMLTLLATGLFGVLYLSPPISSFATINLLTVTKKE